jgi:hypothetical protein
MFSHYFDFAIFKDGKLDTLVDYDGEYFHGDGDFGYNGLQSREENDISRLHCIPDGVKFLIINEKMEDRGCIALAETLGFNYNEWVQDQFNECRKNGFPFYNYSDKELENTYKLLIKYKIPITRYIKKMGRPGIGDKIIHHFHPSIYHARLKDSLSPYEAWHNDELLLKCIKNRFIYVNKVNPRKILQGFNISKIASKISIFSAGYAKIFIYLFLNEFDTIFDPFSGFSGRLLGASSLNKRYIGYDINDTVVKESNNIIKYFNLNASITKNDSRNIKGSFPCLFTCPPYSSKEIWRNDGKEIISDLTSTEWVDICLENFDCKKYLFVVDNKCVKYDDNIKFLIANKNHMGGNYEKLILIDKS